VSGNVMVAIDPDNTRRAFDVDTKVTGTFVIGSDHDDGTDHTFTNASPLVIACDDIVSIDVSGEVSSGAGPHSVCGTDDVNEEDTSVTVTLTNGIGPKNVCINPEDNYGNHNTLSTVCDTIRLDSSFTGLTVNPTSAPWGKDVTISGILKNFLPGDNVNIKFGSPEFTIAVNGTGGFSKTSQYARPSVEGGSVSLYVHQPTVTAVGISDAHGVALTSNTPTHTVLEHIVRIDFDSLLTPLPSSRFTVSGNAVDEAENNKGIPGLSLTLIVEGKNSTQVPAFPNPTTKGITFNAGVGNQIVDQGSYWVFPTDATISIPKSVVVTVEIKNVDVGNSVNLELYPDASQSQFTSLNIQGGGANGVSGSSTSPSGFEKIIVRATTPIGTNNISRIILGSGSGINTFDIAPTSSAPFLTKTFNGGTFVSEGYAKNYEQYNLKIQADYDGSSVDYLPATNQFFYNILSGPQTLQGYGGTESAIFDRGTGRTMISCAADFDLDGICDEFEGTCAACGVPFVVGADTFYYKFFNSNSATSQLYFEHDNLNYHRPLQSTLDGVAAKFAAHGITQYNMLSDTVATLPGGTTLAHNAAININIWQETTPTTLMTQRTDSFNEIKGDWYGTGGEKVVLGGTSSITLGSQTLTPTTRNVITVNLGSNDNNFKVPSAPPTTPTAAAAGVTKADGITGTGGKTQGFIIYTIKLQPAASTPLSVGLIGWAPTATQALTFYAAPTVTLSAYEAGVPYQIATLKIPFKTAGTVTTAVYIPQVTITITQTLTTANAVTMTVLSPSPSYTTTLLDAKAPFVRYVLWGHSAQVGGEGSSGQCEFKGNDCFISLGYHFGGTNPSGHTTTGWSIGSVREQQGTLMHEMGHALGLLHKGDTADNCVPNYFSLMSYTRQMGNYPIPYDTLDYSNGDNISLTENSGQECSAYSSLAGAVYGPAIIETPTNNPANDYSIITGLETAIDWDRIGGACPSGVTDIVSANINNVNIVGCNASTVSTTPFTDFDDWGFLTTNSLAIAPAAGSYDGYSQFFSEATGGQRIQILFSTSNYDLITPTTAHSQWGWSSVLNIKFKLVDANGVVIQVPGLTADVYRAKVTPGVPVLDSDFVFITSGGYSNNDQTVTIPVKFLKVEKGATFQFRVFAVNPAIITSQELVRDSIPADAPQAPEGISFDVTIT